MLCVVCGAPGSGKSTTALACTRLTGLVALDMDALLAGASRVAGADVRFTESTWPAYNALWLDVLSSIEANGINPVLFAPLNRNELARTDNVFWALLDANDDVLRARLASRGWEQRRVEDAIADARDLRAEFKASGDVVLDSGRLTPEGLAAKIQAWQQASG